jgi:UDP-3-O-[3-hydroxymyristoyl] glucosamine N-acyltransferase
LHIEPKQFKEISMKLALLAELTDSILESGDPDLEIIEASGLETAGPGSVAFLANPRYTPLLGQTNAGAIFLNGGVDVGRRDIAVLRCRDAYLAHTRALRAFYPEPAIAPNIHSTAVIDPSAEVAGDVEIGAHTVIGAACKIESGVRIFPNVTVYRGAAIGRRTTIHSGVSVRENCEIGADCIIHNNATIGGDGFGFAKTEDKKWLKIPQPGRVVIEDDVEIGANTSIDRASVGETRIKRGAKIDSLVQIGHSCVVGEDSLICAQTGLAGSSVIGDRVILAGQVGIAGHLKIGDDAVLTAKSATSHDVEPGKVISGVPGFDNREWLRSVAGFRRLGELFQSVRDLAKRVTRLENKE